MHLQIEMAVGITTFHGTDMAHVNINLKVMHLHTLSTPWTPKRRWNSSGGQRRALYDSSSHRPQITCEHQ